MQATRRTTIWAGVLVAILLAAVVLAPAQGDTRWLRTLHNTAHGPVFGCVALLLLWALRAQPLTRGWSVWREYAVALAGAAALGVATEIMQIPVARDASLIDAINDALGAAAFLAGYLVIDRQVQINGRVRMLSALLSCAGLLVLAQPIAHATYQYYQREQRFPFLADFSVSHERYFLRPQFSRLTHLPLPEPWAQHAGETALQIELLAGPYPGWELSEPLPDWRGYETLAVDITNPDDTALALTLRVHDAHHDNRLADRFNMKLELPGQSRQILRVPLSEVRDGPADRPLDLAAVRGVMMFAGQSGQHGRRMYLSRIWLE